MLPRIFVGQRLISAISPPGSLSMGCSIRVRRIFVQVIEVGDVGDVTVHPC